MVKHCMLDHFSFLCLTICKNAWPLQWWSNFQVPKLVHLRKTFSCCLEKMHQKLLENACKRSVSQFTGVKRHLFHENWREFLNVTCINFLEQTFVSLCAKRQLIQKRFSRKWRWIISNSWHFVECKWFLAGALELKIKTWLLCEFLKTSH